MIISVIIMHKFYSLWLLGTLFSVPRKVSSMGYRNRLTCHLVSANTAWSIGKWSVVGAWGLDIYFCVRYLHPCQGVLGCYLILKDGNYLFQNNFYYISLFFHSNCSLSHLFDVNKLRLHNHSPWFPHPANTFMNSHCN